jgi:hypothetical protein
MGLKQEVFYVIIWTLVALGVVVMFDRTGRLAILLSVFVALAAAAAGLTWGIIVAFSGRCCQVHAHLANKSCSGLLYCIVGT